jgi:predicted MFS family arabinose efflux permease
MVFISATLLGLIKVFDNPTRQTFVREMVGKERLANAVSLNSTEMNLARVIGPTIAGALAATVGLGACFLIDGLSYGVVVIMLAMMRATELRPSPVVPAAKGQLAAGFRYVRSTPVLLTVLSMMAIVGMFTYEFSVALPLLAEFTFGSSAGGYAALTAAMGAGAVVGGLYTASRRNSSIRMLALSSFLFGLSVLLVALAPTLLFATLLMLVVGFFSINFTSLGNVTLQFESSPDMQGRVMALWSVAFLGTTPIGGPVIGYIGEHAGARWALLIGGVAAVLAAGIGFAASRSGQRSVASDETRPVSPTRAVDRAVKAGPPPPAR